MMCDGKPYMTPYIPIPLSQRKRHCAAWHYGNN